jgi:hypothetical protein
MPFAMKAFKLNEGRQLRARSRRVATVLPLAAFICALLFQFPSAPSFEFVSPAIAKEKGKGKDKDKDKDKDRDKGKADREGGDDARGGGKGIGEGGRDGKGEAKAVDNGITNGNGLAVGLGEGVGLGVGVGDDDTVGVGLGISVGGDERRSRRLENDDDDLKLRYRSGGRDKGDRDHGRIGGARKGSADQDTWRPGKGGGGRDEDGEELNLGKQFDVERIRQGLRPNLDELGKLLDDERGGADDFGDALGSLSAVSETKPGPGKADDLETTAKAKLGGGDKDLELETAKTEPASKTPELDEAERIARMEGRAAQTLVKGEERAATILEKGETKAANILDRAEGKSEAASAKAEAKAANVLEKAGEKAAKALEKAEAKAARILEKAGKLESSESPTDNAQQDDDSSSALTVKSGSYVEREVLALGLGSRSIVRAQQLGFSVGDTALEREGGALITLYAPPNLDALQAIRLLRKELPSDAFHLNRIYRPYNIATDPQETQPPAAPDTTGQCAGDRCFGRTAIGWKEQFIRCSRGVSVGIIDTDADLRHPAFAGQKITHKTFIGEGKQTSAKGHGTGVLALLAGRRDSGTPGLLAEGQFFFANVFFTDNNGETITDTVSLLKALDWMDSSRARVVNMSFSGPEDELVEVQLKAMRTRGFVFAAAAGNEGPAAAPSYPAAYPEVVAVTAVTKDMRVYPSANRGPYIDLAAPGVQIWTALPSGKEGYRTGTSFATPFATAVLALQNPGAPSESTDELLEHTKTVKLEGQMPETVYGRGLIQAPDQCPDSNAPIATSAR